MSEAIIAKLVEAGTPAALIAEVAMALGRAQMAVELLEGRRAKDRARKAVPRNSAESEESAEIHATPFLNKETPQTPKEINPIRMDITPARGPFPKPEWADQHHWTDFLSNRKRKRLPNTASAHNRFLTDVARVTATSGIPPPELLRIAAENGWASINEPDDRGMSNGRPQPPQPLRRNRPNLSDQLRAINDLENAGRADHAGDYGTRSALPSVSFG